MYNAINLFTRGFLELYLIKLLFGNAWEKGKGKGKGKGGGGMRFPYRHACADMPSAYDAIRPTLFWTYICAYKPPPAAYNFRQRQLQTSSQLIHEHTATATMHKIKEKIQEHRAKKAGEQASNLYTGHLPAPLASFVAKASS